MSLQDFLLAPAPHSQIVAYKARNLPSQGKSSNTKNSKGTSQVSKQPKHHQRPMLSSLCLAHSHLLELPLISYRESIQVSHLKRAVMSTFCSSLTLWSCLLFRVDEHQVALHGCPFSAPPSSHNTAISLASGQ